MFPSISCKAPHFVQVKIVPHHLSFDQAFLLKVCPIRFFLIANSHQLVTLKRSHIFLDIFEKWLFVICFLDMKLHVVLLIARLDRFMC